MQSSAPFARIGTRGSPLALKQAQLVRGLLAAAHRVAERRLRTSFAWASAKGLPRVPIRAKGAGDCIMAPS